MLEKHQLTGPNFNEWLRALKLVVRTEKLQDVFETPLPPAPAASADNQALADWNALFDRHNEVACLMLGTMSPKLYQQFENKSPQEMITELQKMYGKPPGVELQELVNMFHSLLSEFTLSEFHALLCKLYNMQSMEKTISEVHSLLLEFEKSHLEKQEQIVGCFFLHQCDDDSKWSMTIKAIRSDRGGEYISQEFKDYLKAYGIVQQLTPPYTPQHNGVSKRGNRTLLNMVRSMMSLTTLLVILFWDYALEVCCTLFSILIQPEGYLKKTMGYYFYYPPENKIVVERYADFLEKVFILQKIVGEKVRIDDEDICVPSENTSEHPIEEESLAPIVSQEEDVVPVRRSVRTHKASNRLCLNVKIDPHRLSFNIEVEEHSLGILMNLLSIKQLYRTLNSKVACCYETRDNESMNVNKVWITSRLVAKGFMSNLCVDYEIWAKWTFKTAFLNGFLEERNLLEQHEGFIDPNHHNKVVASNDPFYGISKQLGAGI
ncbi:retrotransposon protein, putative, ty1-copia subclass [Tanacetum coccineum]